MSKRHPVGFFTGAYGLARSANLFQTELAKRILASSYFVYKRFWEDPFWNLIHRHPELLENGNILDIGANIGYTSYVFAKVLKREFRVYSFEPDQANFKMLTQMIERKKLRDKVIAVNAAIGSREGTVEFWHNREHAGDHRVVTDHFKSACDPSLISSLPMTSVDTFVGAREIAPVSLIKIDVQGYEPAVCAGMEQTLSRFPELCVCCEYGPQELADLGFDPADLLKFFRVRGYRIYILTRSSIEPASNDQAIQRATEDAGYADLLCSRRALD